MADGDVQPISERLILPMGDDMHTHLRQGQLMDIVTRQIRKGGWTPGCGSLACLQRNHGFYCLCLVNGLSDRVLVMPNTVPPIVTCSQALKYRNELLESDSRVDYLMTLYLTPDVDPNDLAENAKRSHVVGVKLYPRGVTTNSDDGVEQREGSRTAHFEEPEGLSSLQDLSAFHSVFKVMESCGLTLHIHGEMVGAPPLRAEDMFLPAFEDIHSRFPDLKIVFEHISTAAAVRAVKGKRNVAATITAHHLRLTIADVFSPEDVSKHMNARDSAIDSCACYPHNFCKPVAKLKEDREELIRVIQEGNPQFFLGSDSAPHPRTKKDLKPPAAGVFTQPFLIAYLADSFSRAGCLDKLRGFVCENAAAFFGFSKKELVEGQDCIVLEHTPCVVPSVIGGEGGPEDEIVPFLAGEKLAYTAKVAPFTKKLLLS